LIFQRLFILLAFRKRVGKQGGIKQCAKAQALKLAKLIVA